jgi:hypothetical protein
MLREFASTLALAVNVVLLLSIGCAHTPSSSSSSPEIWLTYARNVPHATHQRVNMFSRSEVAAVVVRGFQGQWVTVSLHELQTGKLIGQTTQYVQTHAGRGIPLTPLRTGQYVVRASQEGILKAEAQFSVRE